MTRRVFRAAAILAVLTLPSTVWAGGFEQPENGTRALGRGGAYVAKVDEPSAVYFNPAGLSRVRSSGVTLNMNLVSLESRFERAPYVFFEPLPGQDATDRDRREIQFDPVENSSGIFPAPMFFAASNFGLERWTFGVGAYGPSAYGTATFPAMEIQPDDFEGDACGTYRPCRDNRATDEDERVIERDGGQAFAIVEQELLLVYPSLAVAYELPEANLSFGLTAQLGLLFVDYTVGIDGSGTEQANDASEENEAFYSEVDLHVNGIGATGIAGVMWDPHERVSVGLSYRPRFNLKAEGDMDISFPAALDPAELSISDTGATLRIKMPDVVRFGVLYRHFDEAEREIFDIELDFVGEFWERLNGFDVQAAGEISAISGELTNPRPVPDIFLGRNYLNTYSLRLGSDISALRNPETGRGPVFRVGALWESNGARDEWTSLDFLPFMKIAGTVGFSYHIGGFSLDAAYAYFWSPPRTVKNGESDILVPLWICEDTASPNYPAEDCAGLTTDDVSHAVNDGRYEVRAQTISLGLTYGW